MPFLYLTVLAAWTLAQTASPTPTPQKTTEVLYDDILKRLKSSEGEKRSKAEVNAELIKAIETRGIYFALNDDDRNVFKGAGASDELLRAIDNALPESERKKILAMYNLYKVVLDNYYHLDKWKLTVAINAAKQFIALYGSEEREKDIVDWLKKALPRMEWRLKDMDSIR